MNLLRWAFVCLMIGFASGLLAAGTTSPALAAVGMNVLYLLTVAFVVLASLGTFVYPQG